MTSSGSTIDITIVRRSRSTMRSSFTYNVPMADGAFFIGPCPGGAAPRLYSFARST
jgi:hypothetical protein